MLKVNHNLPDAEVDDINCHHEAGHACMMAMCHIPILRFERLPRGAAQIVPDPSSNADGMPGLYARFVAARASRYSQKLSSFNTSEAEAESFPHDNDDLSGQATRLFNTMQATWTADQPSPSQFEAELLSIADAELTLLYDNEAYKTLVRNVAAEFMKVQIMEGMAVVQLVKSQWDQLGLNLQFTVYSDFLTVLTRTPSGTTDGD